MIQSEIDGVLKQRKLEDLIEVPIIVRVNKFDEASAKDFSEAMQKAQQTSQSVIPVLIDSFGGQVYSLLSMIDTLRMSTKPVATIVTGKAMSCGAVLFTCGREGMRYCGRNATVMIHDVSSFAFGKVEDIKADVKEAERLNDEIYRTMEDNIGKPRGYLTDIVRERCKVDWFMTAEEALHHNIANHIRVPAMKVKVSVQMNFG